MKSKSINKNNYNYFVDVLKFIFSLIIVVYHGLWFTDIVEDRIFSLGFYAVDFYFIVSGFLMINSIEKNKKKPISTLEFEKRKIQSIFPYILFAFLVGGYLAYGIYFFKLGNIFSNVHVFEILQLGILGSGFDINGSTWYISAMLISFLLLYPLAVKFKDKYHTLIAPIILCITLGIVIFFKINVNAPFNKDSIFLNGLYKGIIFLTIGSLIYHPTKKLEKIKFKELGLKLITFIEVALYLVLILNMHFGRIHSYLEAILFAIALMITFSGKSYTTKIFNHPIFKKLGTFGFIMYLNNMIVRKYFFIHEISFGYKKTLLAYFIATTILSVIAYFLVPFLVKVSKRLWEKFKKLIIKK